MKAFSSPGMLRSRRAFTLMEVLTVISIIAILAALVLKTAGYVQETAGNKRAQAEIEMLSAAIEAYKIENGTYPLKNGSGDVHANKGSDTDSSTKVLIDELIVNPMKENRKPYGEINIKMLEGYRPSAPKPYEQVANSASYLVDPFGNSYHYEYPGDPNQSGTNFFDLYSTGKNGRKNAGNPDKWIKNW